MCYHFVEGWRFIAVHAVASCPVAWVYKSSIKSGLRRVRNCVGEQVLHCEMLASSYAQISDIFLYFLRSDELDIGLLQQYYLYALIQC